jgi:hypothetical protein
MAMEFNLLEELKNTYRSDYNFIHICIDAQGTKEKAKSFIYRNLVGGYHLLPEQESAFRKSLYRKSLKIRDFPYYVITNNSGDILDSESIKLDVSNRLSNKLNSYKAKK